MKTTRHSIMVLILVIAEFICLLSSCRAQDTLANIPVDIEIVTLWTTSISLNQLERQYQRQHR